MEVRFGLIGFGRFGAHHARAITNTKDAKLVAISARSEETCRKAKEIYKVDTYINYKEMLKRKDIDVVNIVVPIYLHKEVAVESLNHGKHVLLEKPMATTIEDCDAILRSVKKNKKILHIGFEMRISPLWRKIKEMIDEDKIGKPVFGMFDLWRGPYRFGSKGWRYEIDKVGSWILEEPVHSFDLACWYMESIGEPESVYGRTNSCKKDLKLKGLTENMSFVINFPKKAYVIVNQTVAAYEYHQRVKIVGTEGTLYARWDGPVDETANPTFKLEYFNGKNVSEVKIEEVPGELYEIEMEIKAMVEAVKRGKPVNLATGEDGKRSIVLCIAGEKSAKLNKIINV